MTGSVWLYKSNKGDLPTVSRDHLGAMSALFLTLLTVHPTTKIVLCCLRVALLVVGGLRKVDDMFD
jgi:hypothetical protein